MAPGGPGLLQQSRASQSLSDLSLFFSISKTFHKQLEIQRKAVLDGIYLRKKTNRFTFLHRRGAVFPTGSRQAPNC